MPSILGILQHTPWWAFALFALVTWLGLRGLRPSTVPIWRLLIIPTVFIEWGLAASLLRSLSSPILIVNWLVTAAVGAAIAWTTRRLDDTVIDHAQRRVSLPGSAWPLFRNLLYFSAQYGLGVAAAIAPAARADLLFWNIAVSGASAGYFLGWLARFASHYRQTADQGRVTVVPS